MKRFFLIFAMLAAAFSAPAQEADIPEISFTRTIGIVGVPADTLAGRMNKWLATNELTARGYNIANRLDEAFNMPRNEKLVYCSIDAPNYFRGNENAYVVFLLTAHSSQFGVIVTMNEIKCHRNPVIQNFYGKDGELFRKYYDKKHYSAGLQLLEYLSEFFNQQCSSLEAYLKSP